MRLSEDGRTLIHVDDNDIKNDGSFDIPCGVTSIGDRAFENCYSLKQVTIPKSVTLIGEGAFSGCKRLQHVPIPESVTAIGNEAFTDCWCLQQVTIPKNVTLIGDWAFRGCVHLRQISFPETVTYIGRDLFFDCPSLQRLFINSLDESNRNRIIQLLPNHLHNMVMIYSMEELNTIWKQQLNRINNTPETNSLYRWFNHNIEKEVPRLPNEILGHINTYLENPYYCKAKTLMRYVPLPTKPEDKQLYEDKIKSIVDECIQKAVEFNKEPDSNKEEPDSNNYSFLLNALTVTAAVGALALIVAAFVTALVIASLPLSISLLAAGAICGVVAAGTFFYHSSTKSKEVSESNNPILVSM